MSLVIAVTVVVATDHVECAAGAVVGLCVVSCVSLVTVGTGRGGDNVLFGTPVNGSDLRCEKVLTMKKISLTLALVLGIALFASACGSDDDVTQTTTGPSESQSQTDESATDGATDGTGATDETDATEDGDVNESIERLWIGPELVDCIGEAPQKCMQIRRTEDGQVEWFYDQIEGFTHQIGTSYVIDVAVTDVENPPADASSLSYRLVEIIEETNISVSEVIDGTSWTLLGFRDGDMFDAISDDVEITINFDGENVNGSAGCNSYMGTFTADGAAMTFGPLGSTRMMCSPEVMTFEDRFLPLIGTTESAELTFDGTLVLTNPTGPNLVFAPAG